MQHMASRQQNAPAPQQRDEGKPTGMESTMGQYAPPAHRLIDPPLAAIMLGVSVPTIRRLVVAGKLTNYGTTRKFRLDAWQVSEYRRTEQ